MKKILLMLALMLPCLGAWAEIQPSTNTDVPEKLYKIKSKKNIYMAAHANPTQVNYGRFAFYAVDGKENTYKIYSYDADLWLSYTMAATYSNGMNFVSFEQTQENANEWCITEATNGYYQVAPYNTTSVAGRYWNFFGGIANTYYAYDDHRNTLGLYNKNADDDEGSAWTLEAVAADDYTAPETLNYELTDGDDNVYSGTYTGVAGRTRFFTPQNACPITNVTWEGNTYKANITFPFPVSNAETTNKLMINGYENKTANFKVYAKESTTIKVDKDLNPTTANIDNYLWAIYPTLNEGVFTYTIKNIETDNYIYTTATSGSHDANVLSFNETPTPFTLVNDSWGYSFKVADKKLYLSINSSGTESEQPVGLHGNTHAGSSLGFIPYVINYTLTDAANNIFTGEAEGWAALEIAPTFTGAEGYTLSNQVWDANAKTLNATIAFPFLVSSETTTNLITIGQGTWGSAEGGAYAKLWTVVDGNVKVINGTPTLGTAQWMVYPTLKGTKFGFKIKSASTSKFVTANLASGNDAQATNTPVTLTTEGTEFSYIRTTCGSDKGFAYTNNEDVTMYLTRNGENDNDALLGVYQAKSGHKGNGVRFPEFNQYKVVIGATGYTTIYSPFPVLTEESGNPVEVYTIASQEVVNNKVQLTEMPYIEQMELKLSYIPGESAAILKGEPGAYLFLQAPDFPDMNEDWAENMLEGSSVSTYVAGEAYVLGVIDEEVGLYKAELNMNAEGVKVGKETGTHFLNNAGKAYLPASFTTSTQGVLRFNFGGTTAIESVLNNSADANAPIYDLSGRRVMNTVKGGIYIQNGKKFIVK